MSTSNCETDILLLASWSTLLLKTLTGLEGTTVQVFYLQIEHPTPCLTNYFFLHPILYPGLKYFTLSCKRSSRAHLTLPDLSASGVFWEMGEGSLNSPGQEPNLTSWLSGGTLLRLFLFFMGRDLRWSNLSIHLCMGFLSSPSDLPPIVSPSSQCVGTRTGQSISTAVSPRLSTQQEHFPLPIWTPLLWYWNQMLKEEEQISTRWTAF